MKKSKLEKLLSNCKQPEKEKDYFPVTDEHKKIMIEMIQDLLLHKDEFKFSGKNVENLEFKLNELLGGATSEEGQKNKS